jgi:uridine phosphorylase
MRARHAEVMRLGAACYSMEAADLFVWCATQGGGLPVGAINAVFANRRTDAWEVKGEELAAHIALDALCRLADSPSMADYVSRRRPVYRS